MKRSSKAFTLVELMVVVAIIVILIALLAPSLEKAIYQAELVQCSAKLKVVASGTLLYAMDNKRFYPARLGCEEPHMLDKDDYDLRPTVKKYLDINKMLQCPLTIQIDLEDADPPTGSHGAVYSSYYLWFGFSYGQKGMSKIGDHVACTSNSSSTGPVNYRLRFLASDHDVINGTTAYGSHPDSLGYMSPVKHLRYDADPVNDPLNPFGKEDTYSKFYVNNRPDRGLVDTNFAYEEGAVVRMANVHWNSDERMARIPHFAGQTNTNTLWANVPK